MKKKNWQTEYCIMCTHRRNLEIFVGKTNIESSAPRASAWISKPIYKEFYNAQKCFNHTIKTISNVSRIQLKSDKSESRAKPFN